MDELSNKLPKVSSLESIKDKDWNIAQERFAIIAPIIDNGGGRKLVNEASEIHNVNSATIYRWINRYMETGNISSLVPNQKTGGKGKSRLDPKVDKIINDCIEEVYLTSQKKSMQKVYQEAYIRCIKLGLEPPRPVTIRNRIGNIPEITKIGRRRGIREAQEKFFPHRGSFPGADFPLSVIQIDHTKLDIILVDELHRKPVGRPWITVAIDIYSRMVVGYHVSFDPPGAMGTGLCIANAILPKEKWLAKLDLDVEWPCWGIMRTIHADNAKEFRGTMLKRACQEYNINLEWRPVADPHWGGHIERLMGTIVREIHALPGTTFAKVEDRNNYNSEKRAALSLQEFEKWLTIFFTEIYHKRVHKGIHNSPLEKYREGIYGTSEMPGVGSPERILDERKVKLDFMPYEERSIQEYGVLIGGISYYHDVLRRWIHHTDPNNKRAKIKTKFIFKKDPRDISIIYFYDPEFKDYYPIPYRDTSNPPMSIWEYKEVIKRLKENGFNKVTEADIFSSFQRLKEIEENAVRNTRSKKRKTSKNAVRKSIHKDVSKEPKANIDAIEKQESVFINKSIKPFDDLEDGSLT